MLLDLPIKTLATKINSGEIKATDVIEEAYDNIAKYNPQVNALITIRDKQTVLLEAKKIQAKKESPPLKGVPFVLKDSYVTKDVRTTAASKVLENYTPQYNATVYQRLIDAGAILVAKGNMDAWGHGASTENNDFGPTKNPYSLDRIAGGSSGGPAVANVLRMCSFGIGEDTGGSIRNPAAWTNTVGLKVTYGRVSRYGCIAYASSFDTVGPMAKTVADVAYVMETIAGVDPYDATSAPQPVPMYSQKLESKTKYTIGIPKQVFHKSVDPDVLTALKDAAKKFEDLGHPLKEVSIPMFEYGLAIYYLIGPSETSSNLARYDGVRYGLDRSNFTQESMRRIMMGTYALSSGYYDAYYRQAQKGRTLLRNEYFDALQKVDVTLMPVNPTMPNKFGELVNDPIANMLADMFTFPQNIAGIPSLALPAGFSKQGLPIGIQISSSMFSEDKLLALGHHYQQATNFHLQKPKL